MGWSRTNEVGKAGDVPRMAAAAGSPWSGRAAEELAAGDYVSQPLPIPLTRPAAPPWLPELSRLLDRRSLIRDEFMSLRTVERVLRMPGAGPRDLPDEVIRVAGMELRWLARRDTPSRALARLLDQFEHHLLQPALRRLQQSRPAADR